MRNFSHGAIRRAVALFLATSAAVSFATPASALIQSWYGYLWSRTGNLSIQLGNNLTSAWSSRLGVTASAWSAADYIDFRLVAGGTSSATCGAVYGTVQVCNSNYGANGWLGYTYVWTSGGFIVKATVRLNDYYFSMPKYNTDAWRNATICHEVGHTVGLQHSDTIRTNLNIGSCLDYTNDPSGKLGTNGTNPIHLRVPTISTPSTTTTRLSMPPRCRRRNISPAPALVSTANWRKL